MNSTQSCDPLWIGAAVAVVGGGRYSDLAACCSITIISPSYVQPAIASAYCFGSPDASEYPEIR